MVDIVIKHGRVVTPSGVIYGGVAVEGEQIVAVGADSRLPAGKREIDAQESYIIPGLIDPHVHLGLSYRPGTTLEQWREDFETESEGAIHGGVTTCMSHWRYSDSYLEKVDQLIAWGNEKSRIDFNFHPVIGTETHLADMPALCDKGITSFKFYFTAYREVPGFPAADEGTLYRAFSFLGNYGYPAVGLVHAEDIDIVLVLQEQIKATGRQDLAAWTLSRPHLVEIIRMASAMEIAKATGATLYFAHVTTVEGADMIKQAQAGGWPVWAETQPCFLTHTMHDEEDVGSWGKINPALKDEADRERLWRSLIDGSVTNIGTDHLNWHKVDKEVSGRKHQAIWENIPGFPNGMESMLPVLMTAGVNQGRITIEDLVRVASTNTAKVFGLYPRKGILAPGSDADIVIVNPHKSAIVDENFYHGQVRDWSLYWGWEMRGLPVLTMVHGKVMMEDGETVGPAGHGRFIPCRTF